MEIQTHVLTNPQHLDAGRQKTARDNITAAKKPTNTSVDNLAGFDSDGEIVDSGVAKANLVHDENYVHTENNYTTADKNKLAGINEYVKDAEVSADGKKLTLTKSDNTHVDFMGGSGLPTPTKNGDVLTVVNGNAAWAEPAHVDVNGKMDKVQEATENKLVAFDDEGNAKDSGIATSAVEAALSKLDGISEGANKVEASETNGNIKINNVETPVYAHPTAQVHEAAAVKVGNDAQGHVVLGAAIEKGDIGLGNVDNTSDADKPISTATQTALDKKVDKVDGKGLSTEDYTTAEQTKLEHIEAGAQVNVIETVKVNGTALTPDNKAVDIDLSGYKTKQTAVVDPSAEGNGLTFIASASQDANGEMTVTKKTVQDGTTSQKGVVQLEDSHESTATDKAATPKNVKEAYDLASGKQDPIEFDGTYDPSTNKAATVSTVTNAVANKADKVSDAVSGHFASLTDSGNLADSGCGESDFVQSVVDSETNGNIVVDGTEINVYTHPEPDPNYPQFDKKLYKVAVNATGHVITDRNSNRYPTEATDEDIANTGIFDSTYAYNTLTNKGATVAHVSNAVSTAINDLDNTASSDAGNNVQVTVTQENGVVTTVSVIDNSINANDVAGKADTVSGATDGNFAGLNASGNLTDSGSKASDFATAAQGNKADTAIQGVQKNGTDLTPDANKKVNVVVNNATLTVTVGSSSPVEFSADASQNKSVTVPLASFDKTIEPKQYGEGLMTGQEKEKLNDIESGAQANVIEKVQKNGTELTITNKTVNVVVNDGKLKTKIGSAASATNLFSADASTDATLEIPLASVDNTGVTPVYSEGLMSASDKEKLEGIEAGAEENDVETISIGGGTPIAPTTNTTNIDIPLAEFDDTGAQTTYVDGAMSGQDKEKLDKLKNFSKVTISDGAATPTTADCIPADEDDALTIVAGTNITLTKTQGSNEVTIDAAGGTTVSAGRSISIIETPTATGTDYEVSVDGAVGYYGSTKTIPNVSASPTDLLDASAVPNINSENDRFVVATDQTTGYVYLYALQTVHDALDPTNDVAGVDVFTLSYNVQVERTPAYGFYGVAGVQLVRKSTSVLVLHSSTESYPSTVGQCSVNGTITVWNNAGTPTTIDGKAYYGYRLMYVGDVSQGSGDTLGITASFSVVENMSGTAEYTGTVASYSAGKGIEIDQSNEIQAKLGDGLKFNSTDNSIEVNLKTGGGLQFESDGSVLAISLDSVTEEVVDTVHEISSDMDAKLTTNFPYPMITDVSYDFGSLNVNGTCICQLFSVPFRHPIKANETYITVYAKDTGYSQTNVMFGIYEYDPAGNGGTGDTRFVCDTGAVSIHKQATNSVLEFPVTHVNPDHNALYPNCMYYAVLALPPNAGSGIFLASAPNYNAPVNSMPTLNWRMTNVNGITWNDPTNATLDKTQVPWSSSGYNEHNSMNRFFMQIRNHVSQNSGN